ncbi:MAG TPA: hypothetical protein VIK86_02645 [Candidatus Paceibacterota bacterium]
MERKLLIAKTADKVMAGKVIYHLLEENSSGLMDAIPELAGGEQDIIIICEELCKMVKERAQLSLGGFNLASIEKVSMRVKNDSELTMFYPLMQNEIEAFYNCYRLIGSY